MNYIRRISHDEAADVGIPHYRVVLAAGDENTAALGCYLGPGGGPPLHTHDVDLLYYVVSGSALMHLGHGSHQAKAGDLIFVPAGLPHGSDNQSREEEHHLEIMLPGVLPGQPVLRPVKSVDDVPLPEASPVVGSIDGPPDEVGERSRSWLLADESTGVDCARVTAVELASGQEPGPPEERSAERIVVLTAGRLEFELAGERQQVEAEAVAVIPPGLEHRFWNPSADRADILDIEVKVPSSFEKLAPQSPKD